MRKRPWLRWLVGCTLVLAVAVIGVTLSPYRVSATKTTKVPQPQVLVNRAEPAVAQGLPLKEAWRLALQQGQAWNPRAAITEIRSLSPNDQQAVSAREGADGMRSSWEAVVVTSDKTDSQMSVRVVNGAVVYAAIEPRRGSAPPILNLPHLDSTDAIRLALASHPDFAPVAEKGNGFGYVAHTSQDGKVVVSVVGSYRESPARVDFDGTSGNVMSASVYTYASGGILASADGGETWQNSDIPEGNVNGIAAVSGQDGVAYAVLPLVEAVGVWKTTDGGRKWGGVGQLPTTVTWAYGITTATLPGGGFHIVVGTPDGLWVSTDGTAWTRNTSLPAGPPQWLSNMRTSSGQGILVTISAGPNSGVYATSDLVTWQKVVDGAFRLSPTLDGEVAALAGGADSTVGYVILDGKARPLTLSGPGLRAAGEFHAGGLAVSEGPGDVYVSRDGGRTWTPTLRDSLTSIAVSRDGVIIAGGNRSGIFRSADGGQTWKKTVDAGSALL